MAGSGGPELATSATRSPGLSGARAGAGAGAEAGAGAGAGAAAVGKQRVAVVRD